MTKITQFVDENVENHTSLLWKDFGQILMLAEGSCSIQGDLIAVMKGSNNSMLNKNDFG